MSVGVIIQARTGSTRLPEKALLSIGKNQSVLLHVINQVKCSSLIDKIVIATTNLSRDDKIVEILDSLNIDSFRGSEQDVLDRYYNCAKKYHFSVIVRVTSDNPLIDPNIIDLALKKFNEGNHNFITNCYPRTFPQGTEVEIMDFESLERVWKNATSDEDREHVTKYIYKHPTIFSIFNIEINEKISNLRWTVDRIEDLEFVRKIIAEINHSPITTKDILNLLEQKPELLKINAKSVQESISKMTSYEKPRNI